MKPHDVDDLLMADATADDAAAKKLPPHWPQ